MTKFYKTYYRHCVDYLLILVKKMICFEEIPKSLLFATFITLVIQRTRRVSQIKRCHSIFHHNFYNRWVIFI